jgi:hypothetical protein
VYFSERNLTLLQKKNDAEKQFSMIIPLRLLMICLTGNYIAAGYIPLLEGNSIAKLLAVTIFLEVVME